jgi:hypothetical protein
MHLCCICVMLNNTPVRWICKRQKVVETSTYDLKLAASRIATKLIIELRYLLLSLGVTFDGPELMLGNNMLRVMNTLVLSSFLKKKHDVIVYHRLQERITGKLLLLLM